MGMDERTVSDLLQAVRRDIAAAQLQLAELRRLESYLVGKVPSEQQNGASTGSTAFPSVESAASNYLRRMTQADAAAAVLKEAGGGPLDTRAIVRGMIARGFQDKPDRKNLVSSVFAVMSKLPKRFRKAGRGLWALVGEEEQGRIE
jgi:hypothetical protein